MTGKPVNEENLRKRASVSSHESDMICASLERFATKSESEIERTNFNNGGPSFYSFTEEEFKNINDCASIKSSIGSDNYKKFISPLIEKREKVSSCLNRLMLLSLVFAATGLVPGLFYEMKSSKKISEAQKLELNIKENKVSQDDKHQIEKRIAELKNNAKENHDMAVILSRNITSGFMILSFISMICISAYDCISEKRIKRQAWEIYKNQQNTRK